MSYKSQLQTNNTSLQGLIDKANALQDAGSGGSDGSSTAGEWIQVLSLPTTFAPSLGSTLTLYYEIPANCDAVLFRNINSAPYHVTYRTDGYFIDTYLTTDAEVSDADGTGTVLAIALSYTTSISVHEGWYLLPIYNSIGI